MSERLPPECTALAAELRALRERTGTSLAALAERTTASKSSWHRYLAGTKLPPRDVVVELCVLAGESPGRAVALWELAEAARSGRDTPPRPFPRAGPTGNAAGSPGDRGEPTGGGSAEGSRESAIPPAPGSPVSGPAGSADSTPPADGDGDAPDGNGDPPGSGPGGPDADDTASARRRRRRRALVAPGLIVYTALVVTLALLPPGGGADAEAEPMPPGCVGPGCTGKDPESQGCTLPAHGPATVATHHFPTGARMEIRWSRACEAGWARIWLGSVGDHVEIRSPGEGVQEVTIRDRWDAEGYIYTPMVGGNPEGVEACLRTPDSPESRCFTP
ncbi:XRE family transcriptional regulator [Streptomyces sp. ST2-7A]|uniref:helix-turn-helix domain-containing protein n=1 Tax=Streptomyces sp. ST2-7A TaxID=2907214 RepID=UPI001F1A386A|nr:XRE family transcriptional regulator [Streptomyces sp. ST2-7A]MCE7078665.1 XRE family transcriptional regulator [Streptomyces sp. ST2-7A]